MDPVDGMGRGGRWCYTHVMIGGHSHYGTVRSSMKLISAYMQVHSGALGGASLRPWGIETPQGHNWCWLGTTLQGLFEACGAHGAQYPQYLDDWGIWWMFWQNILAHEGGVYIPRAIAKRLAEEGRMAVAVCRCSGLFKCKRPTPKFTGSSSLRCWNVGSTWWPS